MKDKNLFNLIITAMRLTNLEIKGFKSFADKTSINFDKGVTAIVGPNGCGKSNIVDSIRWVLGEQKYSALRSEKMETLIFNGNKNRKASNVAEVSMTFDNTKNVLPTEYSTVTITRKYFRDGESEYYLNGVACRLKDINDLFLDTGIGSDSYSIIELKMIDDILNDKDNARGQLFEEAAGIAKYKMRKKQTMQKLESTEADLSRVEDLVFEIEKNLQQIESQAKKTEKYYKLKEEYKTISAELAKFFIANYKKTHEELKKEEEKINENKINLDAQISKSEAQLEQGKLSSVDQEKKLTESQKIVNNHLTLIRQYENEKKIKNERLNFLHDKEHNLKEHLQTDKKTISILKDDIKKLDEQKENEQSVFAEKEFELKESKEKLDLYRKEHESTRVALDKLNEIHQKLQEEFHSIEKASEINITQINSFTSELERNSSDYSTKQKELKEIEKELVDLLKIKEKKKAEFEVINNDEADIINKINSIETKIEDQTLKLYENNRKSDAKHNEYNLTKSFIESMEGFPDSIKFLKKEATWGKNAPLVTDIILCKPVFKVAVENFLDPYMNYFVVQNLNEARMAVNLLSQAAKGRANFFILDEIIKLQSKGTNKKTLYPESVKDFVSALNVVEADDKYIPLIEMLLGNVFLVEEESQINEINQLIADDKSASENNYHPTFLLKNGSMLKTKGVLSGGSIGLFEGKRIGRIKNMELLGKELKQLESNIKNIKSELDKLENELGKVKSGSKNIGLSKLSDELSLINNKLIALKTKKEQYVSFIDNYEARKKEIEVAIMSCKQKLNAYKSQVQSASERKSESEKSLLETQKNHNEITVKVNKSLSNYNEENIKLHQQQNKLSGLEREITYKNNQVETATKNIGSNTIDLEKVQSQIQEIISTTASDDVLLLEMYDKKEKLDKELTLTEENYYKSRGVIDEIEKTLRTLRNGKEQVATIENDLKDKTNELKLQLNSLKERLLIEFNIKIEDIIDVDPDPSFNETELKDKVDKLKNRLDNYGSINPMAIEAYEEIKKRHTFIIEQKQDLVNAKASLLQTIEEIEKTATEKFLLAFNQIRANFINVFRSLFSEEDNCDLILSDQSDPLESGIDIIAKPKGKRPLSINQLSGGEKTLTATALLFSLYLLKPAPFCIFDEVDAPLDDTNIEKFNHIIDKFSENSQFIIITHNQRTMVHTDIIYGITMPEQGISKVVPVDLRVVGVAS